MLSLCQMAAVSARTGGDAGADADDGSAAVAFEVELALEGVVDGLDDLA